MYVCFELASKCEVVHFVVVYAPSDCTMDGKLKRIFWEKLEGLVEKNSTKESLFVLLDTNARTGHRMQSCGDERSRVFGAYGREVRNDNGKRLLSFPTNFKLALTDTFFRTHKGGISRTHHGTRPNDRKRITYILSRQARRPRVQDDKVVP